MSKSQVARDSEQADGAEGQRKSSRQILVEEIQQGVTEYRRPWLGLWFSGIAAGLEIGFGVLLMGVVLTAAHDQYSPATIHFLVANMYSIGFILIVLGRSELFTEHTALAVLPVLTRRFEVTGLLRMWATVYTGNLIGVVGFTVLLVVIAPAREVIEPWALEELARDMVDHEWWVILLSATLAGWLMGEMGWCVVAARDTIGQIVCVWLIATAIGLAKLHHCIAGSVEVLAGVWVSETLTAGHFFHFLLWATLGNIIGGVVFFGIVKYAHASRTGESDADEDAAELAE